MDDATLCPYRRLLRAEHFCVLPPLHEGNHKLHWAPRVIREWKLDALTHRLDDASLACEVCGGGEDDADTHDVRAGLTDLCREGFAPLPPRMARNVALAGAMVLLRPTRLYLGRRYFDGFVVRRDDLESYAAGLVDEFARDVGTGDAYPRSARWILEASRAVAGGVPWWVAATTAPTEVREYLPGTWFTSHPEPCPGGLVMPTTVLGVTSGPLPDASAMPVGALVTREDSGETFVCVPGRGGDERSWAKFG